MTNEIRPGTAEWNALVERGRYAVALAEESKSERNWRLGDAALEIAPMGADAAHNGAMTALERYADEVGVDRGTLVKYRQVAGRWPRGTRVSGAGWKVHAILQVPERHDLVVSGMTVTQAHAAAGQSTAGRTGPQSDPETRAADAMRTLADPAVAQAADRIRATERGTQAAEASRMAQLSQAAQDAARETDRASGARFLEAQSAIRSSIANLGDAVGIRHHNGQHWTDPQRESFSRFLGDVRRLLELGEMTSADDGSVDWDAELERINHA